MDRLTELLEKEEQFLKENSGKHAVWSQGGPVSLGLVRELIKVVEKQQERLKILESMDRRGNIRLRQEDI